MFWNKIRKILHSLKFRLAAAYAALFAFSFCLIFCLVCLLWYDQSVKIIDKNLKVYLGRFEYLYWTGNDLPVSLNPTRAKNHIEKLRLRIAEKLVGFEPVSTFRDQNGRLLILGVSSGDSFSVDTDPDGNDIRYRKIPKKDRSAELRNALEQGLFGGRLRTVSFLMDAQRRIFASSVSDKDLLASLTDFHFQTESREIHYATASNCRIAYKRTANGNVIVSALPLCQFDDALSNLIAVFLSVGGAILIVGSVLGWLLACKFVSGIDRVRGTAEKIAAGDYSLRVLDGDDGVEISALVRAFNGMTGNTEKLVNELRAISDNIAHDLRTPLTRILGRAELAVRGKADPSETLCDIGEECDGMLRLIKLMMEISRIESGGELMAFQTVDLTSLLRKSSELFAVSAEMKQQKMELDLPSEPIFVRADPARFQQVAANLLDNAVKFTPEGGRIAVSLKTRADRVFLSVADSGCGISAEDKEKIFRRFFRADSSRSIPGNGLGLSMVLSIVHAHNAEISCDSEPGRGTIFTIIMKRIFNHADGK